jgi:Cu(I)/Ag(I) efflux system membrane protein CusA/SilA
VVVFFGLGSFRKAAILFMAIPISMAGGLIFLWIGGFNTSVAVWVGFIAVFGMAVDDGVVKMTFIQESIKEKKPQNFDELKDAIIDADMRRIRSLLMTLVTTIAALLPVLWATSKGSEIMKPMALPIMGGLVFGAITIFVMPVLFSFFEERRILKRE